MRILDRYLVREYLNYCILGILTFVGLFIVVDLFEKLDVFVDHKAGAALVARYYLYGAGTIITQVLPIALLLGSILSLSQLRKYNELTAMQGSGQSPWRLARPLLLAGLAFSIGQYALNEGLGPKMYEGQKRILNEEIKRLSGSDSQSRSDVRFVGSGGRFFIAQFFDARRETLRGVSVQYLDPPRLTARIDADRASWVDGTWRFENGHLRSFSEAGSRSIPFRAYASSEIDETPRDFARQSVDPFHLGMRDLWRYAERIRGSGGETQKYLTNFHLRASFPLAGLIMTLLGAALSLRVVRGGNIAVGLGLSVSVGFAFFAFVRVGQALGYNGTVPPMLAAWLGNLVFTAIGLLLFWKVSR